MDTGGAGLDSSDDIQSQVFKTTLAEIETSRENPEESAESRDCCVICLDSISDPCAALPCGHTHFDFICLVSWLQEHPNCPLCKANVYKVRYTDAQKAEAFYRVPNTPRNRDEDENRHNPVLGPASQRRFTSHNGLLRETARRRQRPPPTVDEAIQRRRDVYRHQLYSLHVGSNRISQYRPPPTPAQFASTPHLVSRARLWIRRELQAFSFLSDPDPDNSPDTTTSPSQTQSQQPQQHPHHPHHHQHHHRPHPTRPNHNAEFLLEYIIAILKTVDLQDSAGQAEAMLADFLGGASAARLFLHELRSWLRSPAVGLAAWDREVQYPAVRREADGEGDGGGDGGLDRGRSRGRGRASSSVGHSSGEGYGERGSSREQGGNDDRGEVDADGRGRSWRDRGGDHWRAGAYAGERGKRKRRNDEVGEGRNSRPRT